MLFARESFGAKFDHRRAPAAELRVGQREGHHLRIFREQGVDGAAEIANAFSMNDSHPENPALPARGQISRHQVLHFARLKRVQIQHTVNRKFHRPIIGHE